ncbi:hypothetical protein QN379_04605 [Glaciimonas sp. Gout2]|uniref:hypothetical protein n=1 Tax=unclassified Glaciimonas TaxID=2644401 RepID=UPI002B2277E4|nr:MULTISPECIES: hypothetical protein [unclassified Glaciimonas]MEB0011499.1 hypothetical protein [Glaciimonas sp. Cout2]MEB0081296.1 hypothetical protein [Glaciimonas sp. Gout2]
MESIITDSNLCNAKSPVIAVGKPIFPASGVEQATEIDYQGDGTNELHLTRVYRSDTHKWAHNYQFTGIDYTAISAETDLPDSTCFSGIGQTTGHLQCLPYAKSTKANDFSVRRGNDREIAFGTETDLSPPAGINDTLTKVLNAEGAVVGYSVHNSGNDTTELYDMTGRLQTITARNGKVQTLTYSDANTPIDIASKPGLLIRVTDAFNRHLDFMYDHLSRMVAMVDPAGEKYVYGYDEESAVVVNGQATNNLTSVTYPDGKKRIYWYNEQDKTTGADLPFALTGITDENGVRYATMHYAANELAIGTELAGGVDQYKVSYPGVGVHGIVADPVGTVRNYYYQKAANVVKLWRVGQPSGAGSAAGETAYKYDVNGNLASETDLNGHKTTYTYDMTRNLELSKVESTGSALARTTTTEWHPIFRLPTRIVEPDRTTTVAYDSVGNVLTKTLQLTTAGTGKQASNASIGKESTWRYTYNMLGQMLTATGPRIRISDVIRYSYDDAGNLVTVTDPDGRVTKLSHYDANGRIGKIETSLGRTMRLSYTSRGWLSARIVTTDGVQESINYHYDGAGQLLKANLSGGDAITYAYDDAHRMIGATDSRGNNVNYALDNLGNRVGEDIRGSAGHVRQTAHEYDALSRIAHQIIGL